ncbi:MAG TPA: hypothetical protein VMB91_00335 [Solirubrobacteraceae bacterium]|nr:hypothetical protein [Solirubrobacteraceae bacterium]
MASSHETDEDSGQDFDLSAAGLRADGGDLRISVEALASKLEESLPGMTRVQRRGGGLFGRGPKRVYDLQVRLGDSRFQLAVRDERVECSRQKEVGGISIKREELDPGAWVEALTGELRSEAQRSAEARETLSRLLG